MNIEKLSDYLLENHMYSELSEAQRIVGRDKADRKTRNHYILGVPAFYGLKNIVAFLIDRGFDVNAVNQKNGFTALHEVAVTGEVEIAKLLLHHKADPNTRDNEQQTPLEKARTFKRDDIISLLEDKTK